MSKKVGPPDDAVNTPPAGSSNLRNAAADRSSDLEGEVSAAALCGLLSVGMVFLVRVVSRYKCFAEIT